MHKYIIMGPQGSGKGTQAKVLCEKLNLVHISVGDIFRWHVQAHTKLAARIKRIMGEGKLVPDDLVEQIVRDRLEVHDWNYGFILDGFPRNAEQARFFLESYDIDAVIQVYIPPEIAVERVMGRRICSQCGLDYHLIYHRPADPDVCDVCGGALVPRADDNEDALKRRLHDYSTQTEPTLEQFRQKELVVDIDGTADPETVTREIWAKLNLPPEPSVIQLPKTQARA